ncbi:sodium bicarbonate transporter-like protein 11 isoform X2 [Gigantopelta aegis]|uniref:sodium bicarbonate transporter-like protein 11 isoform X2 n=1 Tax=Gigantopelta aegis TaxID=1735272 RepID=UPI001B888B9C|nr:sodium bicarbonate transporter-like protein 11 isoform X2 [Gigantopelta aegis]
MFSRKNIKAASEVTVESPKENINVQLQQVTFHIDGDENPGFVSDVGISPATTSGSIHLMPEPHSNSTPAKDRHASFNESISSSRKNGGTKKKLSVKTASTSTLENLTFDDSFIDENGLTLIYSRHEKLPLKDFSNEVRAIMDVQSFIKKTALLLHMEKTNLDEIIEEIIEKMLGHLDNPTCLDQAKAALFTHDYVHQLSRTLQCSSIDPEGGGFVYDQNFVCALSSIPSIQTRYVGLARMRTPANLGQTCQEVYFIVVILTPTKEKGTKNELETGRTFATMLSDLDFRQALLDARNEEEFLKEVEKQMFILSKRQRNSDFPLTEEKNPSNEVTCGVFKGLRGDLRRRLPNYKSDFMDGIADKKSIQKVASTTLFLYFACILPSIAFGVLNAFNTNGILTVEKVLYTQTFGGLMFAFFGGTPQIVLLTTAPLALYTKIIYSLSEDFDLNFQSMFCCVGLWNSFFLILYSVFDLSILMQFSTRSSEEIFALFISIAFAQDAFKNTVENFKENYNVDACKPSPSLSFWNISKLPDNMTTTTMSTTISTMGSTLFNNVTGSTLFNNVTEEVMECHRDVSLLYLLLLLGTLWLGVTLYNFTKTPYLTAGKRELFSDYSLPVSVIIMSFIGAYVFREVKMGKSFNSDRDPNLFQLITMQDLSIGAIFAAMGLGFCLSLLFFMDQNISAALVNAPQNRMKKGTAYHWDLLVISIVNAGLSLICFPWLHAALPHSPLHVRALADMEERVEQGHIHQIVVRVRETRLTAIFSHILIGLSLLIMPVLSYIPTPVLYGLFLYLAVTALKDNQMAERIALFFTEQAAYPPNHYIRRVPQRKMHLFTLVQIIQLGVLCIVGFFPFNYLKMFFPVLIFVLIPFRHKIIPKLIHQKYLNAMDGH